MTEINKEWTKFPNCILDNLLLFNPYEITIITLMVRENDVYYQLSLRDISEKTNIGKTKVQSCIKSLIKKGILEKKEETYGNVFTKLNKCNSTSGCLFCGYNKGSLDKHHYPIPLKYGGTETIKLCSNCHREFHAYTLSYKLKKEIMNFTDNNMNFEVAE